MSNKQHMSTRSLALRLGLAAVVMFGFGFALVPLYDVFCQVTGIRSPIERSSAEQITEQPEASRTVTLELLANTGNSAPWEFHPLHDSLEVQTGQIQDTYFYAKNLAPHDIDGVATPDIRPAEAARYLKKIECFCFSQQHFAQGEERDMLVKFYIDPALPAHIDTVTLAYTIYEKQPQVASNDRNKPTL